MATAICRADSRVCKSDFASAFPIVLAPNRTPRAQGVATSRPMPPGTVRHAPPREA